MKNQSGKIILLSFLLACVLTAVVLKRVFDDSPQFKQTATEQMRMEFLDYTALKHSSENFPVGTVGETNYFISLKEEWKFEIHDKTLVIYPPPVKPQPTEADKAAIQQKAIEALSADAKVWLLDKYHTQKDLLVEVRF